MGDRMVLLFETYDLVIAEMISSELREKDILAHINYDNTRGLRPSLGYVTPIRIMVAEGQLDAARKILEDLKVLDDN